LSLQHLTFVVRHWKRTVWGSSMHYSTR